MNKILKKDFYLDDTAKVARRLLGKILVRKTKEGLIKGKIVETEAYYGQKDPASRAYRRSKKKAGMATQMFRTVGTSFVYVVHAHSLFNVIAKKQEAGGVLIRALQPIEGIEIMFKNRKLPDSKKGNIYELCSGPGKLTKALGITKKHSGLDITRKKDIWIEEQAQNKKFVVAKSHRIGVSADLKKKLRFYMKGNRFVSKSRKNLF